MTNAMLYRIRITGALVSLVCGVLGFVLDMRVLFTIALIGSVAWLIAVVLLANRTVDTITKGRHNR